MASGRPPWSEYKNPTTAMFHIAQATGDIAFKIPEFPHHLSEDGKNFLKLCLRENPEDRANICQLLGHPWIMKLSERSPEVKSRTVSTKVSKTSLNTGSKKFSSNMNNNPIQNLNKMIESAADSASDVTVNVKRRRLKDLS